MNLFSKASISGGAPVMLFVSMVINIFYWNNFVSYLKGEQCCKICDLTLSVWNISWCPGEVVWAVCLERVYIAGSNPAMSFKFQRNKMFLLCSLGNILNCGKFPWSTGSELDLRPPSFEFRILCLEGSFIFTILRKFYWLMLAYNMCPKVAWNPIHSFISELIPSKHKTLS